MSEDHNGPPDRKPRIRPVSRITQSKFSKLKNTRCFPEIDRRLRLGWEPVDLARAVHDEFNEFTDTPLKYLKKLITRYRDQIPTAELSLRSPNSVISQKTTKALSKGLDELAELDRLYNIQIERVEIDIKNEIKINKLLPNTGNEIAVAAKLLKQSAELKMDLGLVKRQMGSVEVTGQLAADVTTRYKNDSAGRIIADPVARKRLMGIADKLLALTTKAGVDAVEMVSKMPDPDLNTIIDIDPDDQHEQKSVPDQELDSDAGHGPEGQDQ